MQTLRIDLVSDVACPWCAIGYRRLEQALETLKGEIDVELHWQPFELNRDMPPEGEPILEHLCQKYGKDAATMEQSQREIMKVAEELGLNFRGAVERRANNTFAAHRVLAWAATQNRETALQLALFDAYFGEAKNPSDPQVLREKAIEAGLDGDTAEAIARSDQYADEVRAAEQKFMEAGVSAVPGFILDGRYLISGAQPAEVLVDALRQVAEENANR
ncbi:putative DsbA family dithiol-disulfide isomerase [Vreelandella songnenensis]|uniref:Putative DsbA family dithiol-disulfide isomerase n=1 Tax=Vreelandella songnenensis TaxID=1176243 RepID=A0A2T0V4K2_9GAMM|nr:DsbA family oxidoreductase [Halomonas songnenensis]PRY65103.1 putative DsbA family dithiol-disulfide isomerase [Halomonas songnenensis]